MKSTRKILSVLLAIVMIISLGMIASAAETFQITAPDNGHTYRVMQVFKGDYHEGVLSNIKWGINSTQTPGSKVPDALIEELMEQNADTLTDVLLPYIDLESQEYQVVSYAEPATNVEPGYYLICDKYPETNEANFTSTAYIIKVAGNVAIVPKAAVPTIEKKVEDVNDSTGEEEGFHDSADHDIGDEIGFEITATVAENFSQYEAYLFEIHDQMDRGLTFLPDTLKVTVNGVELVKDRDYRLVTTSDQRFDVIFPDLKQVSGIQGGTPILVTYDARLNENAVIGPVGNKNTVYLNYSNNPNASGTGTKGFTPEDTVKVFTYRAIINKFNEKQEALSGAEFELAKQCNDEWILIDPVVDQTGAIFTFNGLDDGFYRLREVKAPDGYNQIEDIYFRITAEHEFVADMPRLLSVTGLQLASDGTDLLAEEVTFRPTWDEEAEGLTADVINKAGLILPETGGMGTRLFYLIGTVLVLGAGVLLISKKRMLR